MDILVLDNTFTATEVIDYYESIIWTERYSEAGDFELYLLADSNVFSILKQGYYLYNPKATIQNVMIIEQIEIKSDVTDGNKLIVTGRSLESILDRRVIWPQIDFNGNLQNGVKQILDESVISPTNTNRKIPKFEFIASTDPNVTELLLDGQYAGDNVYEAICDICDSNHLGFKVVLTDDNRMQFSLYSGKDRSWSQEELDWVVFSHRFDNIISSNYLESDKNLKNMVYIGGDKKNDERRFAELDYGKTGLDRRETFVDGSSVSSTTSSGRKLTEQKYKAALLEKGEAEMSKNAGTESFEGEVEDGQTFVFGEHYFIGDIVEIADEYGHEGQARVTEFVRSHSAKGFEAYPTFDMITDQLPQGYTELMYIESTGKQRIDTGIKATTNTRLDVNFRLSNTNDNIIFNTDYNNDENQFAFTGMTYSGFFTFIVGDDATKETLTSKMAPDLKRHDMSLDSYVSQVTIDDPDDEDNPGYTKRITAARNNTSKNNIGLCVGSIKLYSCKMYDSAILNRNFIPCKNPDGLIGVYDTINEKFYSSATSTAFIAGPRA